MTQLQKARQGIVTQEMKYVAKEEGVSEQFILENVAAGKIVIPANVGRKNLKAVGIGNGLKTKINANIGSSPNNADVNCELDKLKVAVAAGADVVMDLSTGGDLNQIRETLIKNCEVPIGTVPIYHAMVLKDNDVTKVTAEDMLEAIELHAKQGIDFITVHCGVLKNMIPMLKKRIAGVVSRGGAFLVKWMKENNKENPLYENFDKILEIAKKYDVTLSLGDGFRPGAIADSTDEAQLAELKVLGELTKKAWEKDVQVMIEGPGHVPINEIEKNMNLQKEYCHGAPFYVLGPLVTDIAPGYDHITSAIGGALAAYHGAAFLCYVTPSEHLGLPNIEEVKEGVIASKIAAHAADIARGLNVRNWDDEISKARANLDWEKHLGLALDKEKACSIRQRSGNTDEDVCSMCGKFCSIKASKEVIQDED